MIVGAGILGTPAAYYYKLNTISRYPNKVTDWVVMQHN